MNKNSPRRSVSDQVQQRRAADPENVPNPVLGVFVAIARQILFIDAKKVALFYLAFVVILSLIEKRVTLDNTYYLVQKHSILNQYGVKLGWFWTLVIVGPFIFLTSKVNNRKSSFVNILRDVSRLGVATAFWWLSVQLFHKVTHATSVCSKRQFLTRSKCSANEGVWTPGIDISGHCFLMIYSILIMTEEAISYRYFKQVTDTIPEGERESHGKEVKWIQYLFVAMLGLHVFWFKQIIISVLYYHIMIEEVLGALCAVVCWFISYRILFPSGFLPEPIRRKQKSNN